MLSNGLMLPPTNAFPCLAAPQYRVSPTARLESTACHRIARYPLVEKPSSSRSTTNNHGIFRTLLSISRKEGIAGLYAGLRPSLLASVPNTAIYFTAYDEIANWLRQNQTYHANNMSHDSSATARGQEVYIPLVAGATARLISVMATAPLELVKTRQASPVDIGYNSTNKSNSILEEFRVLLKESPFALYRGVGPMIMRDVPFSAIYFLGLETFKKSLSESNRFGTWGQRYYQERGVETPTSVTIGQTFVSGAGAGAIATLLTTPFDLIKTRRQMKVQGNQQNVKNQNTFGYMRQIVREDGFFNGLWRGNQIRMIKVAPGCAIMISCYEFGKRYFDDILM